VPEGLPEEANAIEHSRKTTETETRSTLVTAYACARLIPGKNWIPTNQIRALPARAHVYRQLRARALQGIEPFKQSRKYTKSLMILFAPVLHVPCVLPVLYVPSVLSVLSVPSVLSVLSVLTCSFSSLVSLCYLSSLCSLCSLCSLFASLYSPFALFFQVSLLLSVRSYLSFSDCHRVVYVYRVYLGECHQISKHTMLREL